MSDHATHAQFDSEPTPIGGGRFAAFGELWRHRVAVVRFGYGVLTIGVMLIAMVYAVSVNALAIGLAAPFVVALAIPVLRCRLWVYVLAGACLVGVLAVNEALFRVRFFGTDALVHPLRYSPAPDTVLPGFIRESDDPVRGFELTPGFEGFWDGKAYSVNSWGYREREFTDRPAPGVFRIIILGDSYSMASSVAVEDGLSRVMERELNALGHRVEVLNLSVTGYDLPQMQRLLETDVVALHPHLVVLAQFNWVIGERLPGMLPDWKAMVAEAQTRLSRQNLIHSYAYIRTFPPHAGMIRRGLGRVFRRVGIDAFQADLGADRGELALPIFFDRLAELGKSHGFRGMMLVMHPMMFEASRLPSYERDRDAIRELCDERDIVFTDAIDAFDGEVRVNDFLIYAGNNHPNAAGHAATAREVVRQMVEIPGLLPDRD